MAYRSVSLTFVILITSLGFIMLFPTLYRLSNHQLLIQTNCALHPSHKSLLQSKETIADIYGWRSVGYSHQEQVRLHDLSLVISAWPATAEDNVPTVPAISADGHLLVLSAAASHVRYGASITFIMVYPTDVKRVLPQQISSQPLSSYRLNLWCVFDDGSVTPAYSYDSKYGNDRASLLDCPASPYAIDQLWRYKRTLRVYLASLTDPDRHAPILKAFISIPTVISSPLNTSQQLVTLCTSPLQNGADYLKQWILFHYLVGVRKFVVYNTTDTHQHMQHVIEKINRHYPNLVDFVAWNFSSLSLTDVMSTRYFQTEALHDCLIRYGDQSEWLGAIDTDEYIVPMHPNKSLIEALHENFGHRVMGSVNLWSHFFCTEKSDGYSGEENDTNRLVMERFVFRAAGPHKPGREKYLYRPRFVQYLSIHHQIVGLAKHEPAQNSMILAHYAAMARFRQSPGCNNGQAVKDTSIRDRFSKTLQQALEKLKT